MTPSKEQVLDRLRQVKGPDLKGNVVDLGLVSEIFLKDGRVSFSITVPAERASELDVMRQAAEKVVRDMEGVSSVIAVLTADKPGGGGANGAQGRSGPGKPQGSAGARPERRRAGSGRSSLCGTGCRRAAADAAGGRHQAHDRRGLRQGRRRQVHHSR